MAIKTNKPILLLKDLAQENRFAFVDCRSDFRAILDHEGKLKVRNVFTQPFENLDEDEQEIALALVAHGLVETVADLVAMGEPEQRTGSKLSRVELELTKSCNLACLHCFTRKEKDRMDFALIERNLPDLIELGVVEIVLNGGEIFLHEDLGQILEFLGNSFKLILFSNGTVPGSLDTIASAPIARVNVSLDGFRESHDYLRGAGTFDRTVAFVRGLVERDIRTQINSVVFEKNLDRLEPFIEFCREDLKVCGVKLSTIYPMGSALNHPELFENEQSTLHREVYQKYLKEDLPGMPDGNHLPCLAGITKIFIDTSGNVFPCRLFEDERFSMGSLNDLNLGPLYRKFIESPNEFTSFEIDSLEACRNCAALPTCKTGCRARAFLTEGDIRAADTFACRHHVEVK